MYCHLLIHQYQIIFIWWIARIKQLAIEDFSFQTFVTWWITLIKYLLLDELPISNIRHSMNYPYQIFIIWLITHIKYYLLFDELPV